MTKKSFIYGLESEYDYDKVKEKSHDTRQIGLSKYITFSDGKFDNWCVYLVKRGKYGFPYSVKAEIFEKNFHFEG